MSIGLRKLVQTSLCLVLSPQLCRALALLQHSLLCIRFSDSHFPLLLELLPDHLSVSSSRSSPSLPMFLASFVKLFYLPTKPFPKPNNCPPLFSLLANCCYGQMDHFYIQGLTNQQTWVSSLALVVVHLIALTKYPLLNSIT